MKGVVMSKLKKMREARRLRLREVGAAVGCTIAAVQRQEKRGIKKIDTARKYAGVFGCDPLELLD
jgi:transcriptional regulator with XRE-family HTH domain